MATPRPIETHYAGCHFRSRLEARWAVFFDTLGIQWQYEPQGFEHEDGTGRYLPDFQLDNVHLIDPWDPKHSRSPIYVEVKGTDNDITPEYRQRLGTLIDYNGPLGNGLLLLGPIPRVDRATSVLHSLVYWNEGVHHLKVQLVPFRQRTLIIQDQLAKAFRLDGHNTSDEIPEEVSCEALVLRVSMPEDGDRWWRLEGDLADAYTAARSARFGH